MFSFFSLPNESSFIAFFPLSLSLFFSSSFLYWTWILVWSHWHSAYYLLCYPLPYLTISSPSSSFPLQKKMWRIFFLCQKEQKTRQEQWMKLELEEHFRLSPCDVRSEPHHLSLLLFLFFSLFSSVKIQTFLILPYSSQGGGGFHFGGHYANLCHSTREREGERKREGFVHWFFVSFRFPFLPIFFFSTFFSSICLLTRLNVWWVSLTTLPIILQRRFLSLTLFLMFLFFLFILSFWEIQRQNFSIGKNSGPPHWSLLSSFSPFFLTCKTKTSLLSLIFTLFTFFFLCFFILLPFLPLKQVEFISILWFNISSLLPSFIFKCGKLLLCHSKQASAEGSSRACASQNNNKNQELLFVSKWK